MTVDTKLVPRHRVPELWERLKPGLDVYRLKSPHYVPTSEEVREFLMAEDGDELLVILLDGTYEGFITFKVQPLDREVWGMVAMIFLTKKAQEVNALQEACRQLEDVLRSRGATIMNYMTKRKGFARLAPSLGFRPRIIEWMKEL